MKTRRVPLIIGLVLALGTGALLLTYLTSLRPSGTATQTLYYAANTSSPLCVTNAGNVETCTLFIPTLGSTETI